MSDDLQLRVDPELKALFDGLGETDYEGLKQDIKKRGFLVPLIVAQDGTIISGHRRFQVAQELGIKAPYVVREFKNKEEMFEVAITDNLLRRQLNNYERGLLGLKLLPYEKVRAKKRMLAGKKLDPHQNSDEGYALNKAAERVGISHDTLYRVKYIEEEGTEEERERGRKGKSVNAMFKIVKRRLLIDKLKYKTQELPPIEGKYDVIIIDPPWDYQGKYDPEGRRGPPPYPTLTIEEIKGLEIPANDDCVLWLWTPNSIIHEAFHLAEYWGFTPKTILTWVKNYIVTGMWLRSQTEHCIMAIKGKPMMNLTDQSTVLLADIREHSRKPDEFYELVDSLCFGSKLDYFGRERREGWAVYGTLELEEESDG